VIGVEGVAQSQRLGREAEADPEAAAGSEAEAVRRHERDQHEEARGAQREHDRPHPGQRPPLAPPGRDVPGRPARRGVDWMLCACARAMREAIVTPCRHPTTRARAPRRSGR